MSYKAMARRLADLEAADQHAARATYDDLVSSLTDAELDAYIEAIGGIGPELQAMSDEELDRLIVPAPADWADVQQLRAWLEVRHA